MGDKLGATVVVDVPAEEGDMVHGAVPPAAGGQAGVERPEGFAVLTVSIKAYGVSASNADDIAESTVVAEVAHDQALNAIS